ncbi:signal peptidase II [Mangrovimonas xylaniphaga]|uniref:signal peptidase II n=1 Tax=Mangrovimonas xylaniphaga TaxID=1645915 RepID=UPI0006B4032E|nr:signal peptidase II [Mangrovimonas xylaniphaga]
MKISRSLGIVLLIAANIAVDQISKVIIRQSVDPREQISLIGDVFVMMNVENTGAFLGMGSDLNPTFKLIFLLLLPVLVLGYLIYYIFKTKTLDRFSLVALCCIAGGGIANVYDRIVYGSVTDFLHLDFGGMLKTGIFNIADVSVTTGMIMLLVANFFHKKNVKTA